MEPSLLLKNHRAPDDGARPAHVRASSIASDEEGEGPYFDLEFSIPGDGDEGGDSASESGEDDVINESFRSDDASDDLFFKGHSSLLFTPSLKPQLPSALLKSATKFRVFMLRFKKSPRSTQLEAPESSPPKKQKQNNKFLVKFKVEEVPIVSLFTRDSSSSRSSNSVSARSAKLYAEEAIMQSPASTSDEKKNPKDVIHKYLNKIKPLYVRASKRYSDKLRFSGQLSADDPEKSTGGLGIVSKRLRKSRSASAAVAAVRSAPRRRDDSLVEQEDGIQSAIAHCKRSFNAGKVTGFGSDHRVPVLNGVCPGRGAIQALRDVIN